MKLTKPHLSLPAQGQPLPAQGQPLPANRRRRRRVKASALALAAMAVAASTTAVVLGQVQSASAAAKPSASNTGVPRGTKLKVYNGNLTITKAGAVYDALDIRGFVYVKAPNVTLKRSIVRGGVATTSVGLITVTTSVAKNFRVTDTELVPSHPSVRIDGIMGWGFTATRVNIHSTVDGVKVFGDNVTVVNSYIHDLALFRHDPYQGNQPSHNDGIQVLGGHNIRIQYNYLMIQNYLNSALMVSQNHGSTNNLVFSNNWADGATCTVNITYKPMASMSGIYVNSNRFGSHTPLACTIILKPKISYQANGNMMDATNTAARVRVLS